MAAPSRRARDQRRGARLAALALATLANLAILALIGLPAREAWPWLGSQTRPVEVWLAPPLVVPPPKTPPRKGSAAAPALAARPSPLAAPPTVQPLPAAPSPAPPASGPIAGPAPGAGLAATLRRGDVGCAHPDAPWMTPADREACRDRLAAGAARTPFVSGMPAEKLAYYDAVAQAYADWHSGRDAGHPPFVGCGRGKPPPHALKIGPCFIDPPKGSLDLDVDIPPPDTSRRGGR